MPLRARALSLLLLLIAPAAAAAQTPVRPYQPAARYTTFQLQAQVTGGANEGRDVMASWGGMMAPGGAAMLRLEGAAGVTTGNDLIDRLLAGPQLTAALAIPSQHTSFARGTRAEPYLLAGAAAYAIGDFTGAEAEWSVRPAVSGGIGFRIFGDEWDVELSTLELVVEKRFGPDAATELFIRFGRAAPRPHRAASPDGPAGTLLPPPGQ